MVFFQVSKTAPTGEYLTTGSFMIRGEARGNRGNGRFSQRCWAVLQWQQIPEISWEWPSLSIRQVLQHFELSPGQKFINSAAFELSCSCPRDKISPSVIFGSLKPLIKMNFGSTSCSMAAKPPHETLSLFFREKEFPSTFLSDDGFQLLV